MPIHLGKTSPAANSNVTSMGSGFQRPSSRTRLAVATCARSPSPPIVKPRPIGTSQPILLAWGLSQTKCRFRNRLARQPRKPATPQAQATCNRNGALRDSPSLPQSMSGPGRRQASRCRSRSRSGSWRRNAACRTGRPHPPHSRRGTPPPHLSPLPAPSEGAMKKGRTRNLVRPA